MTAERPFLTTEWRWLAMLNFPVHPAVLLPHMPAGTELDTFEGRTHVSIVAFHYFDTRIAGWAVPFHRAFPEVNLRFYVRRSLPDGSFRRGVVFLKEVVPRRSVSYVANWIYGESFVTQPMRVRLDQPDRWTKPAVNVDYAWKHSGRWNCVSLCPESDAYYPGIDSEAAFITEHYWGYTRLGARRTAEYRVEHPPWRIYDATEVAFDCDIAAMYGAKFLPFLSAPPSSAFLVEGSAVNVYPGRQMVIQSGSDMLIVNPRASDTGTEVDDLSLAK